MSLQPAPQDGSAKKIALVDDDDLFRESLGLNLIEEGYEVFVVSDATASRTSESEIACLQRLSASGVGIVTTEMVVFEWLGKAGTPAFKNLLPFIKQ